MMMSMNVNMYLFSIKSLIFSFRVNLCVFLEDVEQKFNEIIFQKYIIKQNPSISPIQFFLFPNMTF